MSEDVQTARIENTSTFRLDNVPIKIHHNVALDFFGNRT